MFVINATLVILGIRMVEFAVDEGSEVPDHLVGGKRGGEHGREGGFG